MPANDAGEGPRPGGSEAVCFTAGPKGCAFGAGVIHAWLASDREPPLVAAGISMGALTTAAMQKCYRELESAPPELVERKRWEWFRRYLWAISTDPLAFLWKAIPDPVDYFAEKPPVKDLSVRTLPDVLQREECVSRRHYHLLTKLGVWLAGIPVRVGTLASIVVHHVRVKEGYGSGVVNRVLWLWNIAKTAVGLWTHILRSPRFYSENSFAGTRRFRPLFGWTIWLASFIPLLTVLFVWAIATWSFWPAFLLAGIMAAILAELDRARGDDLRWDLPRHLFSQLDLSTGLLSQFELRRRLFDIFGQDTLDPSVGASGRQMHALLVCAALQQSKQVWPQSTVKVYDALSGAMAIPGIFPPRPIPCPELLNFNPTGEQKFAEASIVDGVAVRNNPIPAFFEWCETSGGIARRLERRGTPSLHVVYNVPTVPDASDPHAVAREEIDIVESAFTSVALEKRRDTRQEVRQTQFLSVLEDIRRESVPEAAAASFRIFADEIAPRKEIEFRNGWEPTREESLKAAADGCRAALQTLYRKDIADAVKPGKGVECAKLLRTIAPRRLGCLRDGVSGLPEICAHCNGVLSREPEVREDLPDEGVVRSYGQPKGQEIALHSLFSHLRGMDETGNGAPRIVFLGSGGVFRGAFHIGVIGAITATRLFPDLVLGASVGALMGGALASISVARRTDEKQILEELAQVFLSVDERVALTRTLKNASKQLGIRARDINISPAELRRMVLRGSRADPGYAATGAPPALIDAISRLFMIPHRNTAAIASSFVAGHVTQATSRFLAQVRRETLGSLDIQRALIGTSLLACEARRLLGETLTEGGRNVVHLDEVQPYHYPAEGKNKVSFFCTTSFLNARMALLLGRDFLTEDPTWDGVLAGLSSSAFPAVFAPRCEAEVLPGRGRTDRLFADGGMFDNLPFFPAIEILAAVQASGRNKDLTEVLQRVKSRTKNRDIIIAAGLNADPEPPQASYDTLFKIRRRAQSLSVNSKVHSFVVGAAKVQTALEQISDAPCSALANAGKPAWMADFLDGAVASSIIRIVPADTDHINPTFAFCRSAGMNKDRVRRSIADGCFQSLAAFVSATADPTVRPAFANRKVHALEKAPVDTRCQEECPFFVLNGERVKCPFAAAHDPEVVRIRDICAADSVHQ